VRRREFITLIGSAAAWPIAARAQQGAMPLVGYLGLGSTASEAARVAGFKQGLSQAGYVERQNLTIDYRFAEAQFDRLPALAEDLVRHKPGALMAIGPPTVRALKARTAAARTRLKRVSSRPSTDREATSRDSAALQMYCFQNGCNC
jgi:putative tryptophan/tyrosine transport system substrate-binding protein